MRLTIKIALPADRTKTGTLTLIDPLTGGALFGPVPVLGRAALDTARARGNPTGDPLKQWGHTPTGTYSVARIVANGEGTSRPAQRYGKSGSIVLDPTGGDALLAKRNGRTGLLIHAGRHAFSSVVPASALKPTNGCIRMLDFQMDALLSNIRANALRFPGEVVVEIREPGGSRGDIDETVDDGDPPPVHGGPVVLP
jgi:hypothetical protein